MRNLFTILLFCATIIANAQAPANNEPAGAYTLTPSAVLYQNDVLGSTLNATQTITPFSGTPDTDDDVWFYINQLSSGNLFITLSNVSFSNTDPTNQLRMQLWAKNIATSVWSPVAPSFNGIYNTDNISFGSGIEFYVQVCTGGTSATATFHIAAKSAQTIFPNPANDDCATPVVLTSALSCNNIYGTNINATNSTQPFALAGSSKDVWYKFTAQTANNTISLSNIHYAPDATYPIYPSGAGTSDLQIEIGALNCGAYTALAHSNMQPTLTVNNLVPTQEYLVRVSIINTLQIRMADYNICVQHTLPPSNDEPASALPIIAENGNCYNAVNSINSNTLAATESALSHCQVGSIYDTWYSFTATNNLFRAKISAFGIVQNPNLEIWNNALTTQIQCSGNNEIEATVTAGQNYYIRVAGYASTYLNNFTLNALCTVNPQANNNCNTPFVLPQPIVNGATTSLTGQTTAGANQSPFPTIANAGCGAEVGGDLWYAFTALKHQITIRTANVAPASNNLVIQLFAAGCTANAPIATGCGGLLIASLVPGTSYLVRILPADGCDNVTFDINVQVPPSPVNDNCAGAISIPFNSSPHTLPQLSINGTNENATTSLEGISTGCAPYTNISDVWYKFTTSSDANNVEIVVSNVVQITAGFGFLAYSLHHGNCGTLLSDNCDILSNFAPNVIHFSSLLPNTTYLFRLFGTSYQNQFSYKINWRKIPTTTNITCATATNIIATTNQSATFTEGNTYAPADEIDCINPGFGANNRGVWYKFTAVATKQMLEISNVIPLSINGAYAEARVFSGTCAGGLTQLYCFGDPNTQSYISGLIIGQEYFVLVLDNTVNSGQIGFKVRVVGATTPINDEVAGAITLIQNPECISPEAGTFNFSILSAVPSLPAAPVGNTFVDDVWYKFTATTTIVDGNLNLSIVGIGCKLLIYNNALNTILLNSDFVPFGSSNFNVAGLTVGQNYYIRLVQFNPSGFATLSAENNFTICIYGLPTANIAFNATAFSNCRTADGPVTSTNSNTWLHLTDGGDMVASIFDNGGAMGVINGSYYISPTVRSNAGLEYLNRNFDITPTTQPTSPVQVRLYFSRNELLALVGANDGDLNDVFDITDLFVDKFSGIPCATVIAGSGGAMYPVTAFGNVGADNYYLQITIPSFSGFFLHAPTGVVLPIHLISFSGINNNGINKLQWKAAEANNFSHFEIEKSTNGNLFIKIGTLQVNVANNYSFQDVATVATNYYRLKMLNADGTFTYSNIVKLVNASNKTQMIVYPNPVTTNNLQLNITAEKNATVNFLIYNLQGKKIDKIQKIISLGNQVKDLNITHLPNGIYFIEAIIDNKQIQKQFIKL